MNILEALKSISNYPVPQRVYDRFAAGRGLNLVETADIQSLKSNAYRLTEADVSVWIANAPNIAEGGVNFGMLVTDRAELRKKANAVYKALGDDAYEPESKVTFGYKGDSL